ncbi:MAG: methyltransferase domain-containing protein [Candidatus Dadabacteria bacterium]|nr:methyltransferase domain-containing protein [Candidatus Dadabacteria bacterium]NIQ15226.1 methyltransferase domain-containing protein [Candidatus Dadabacteria bacterium]
MKKFYADIVDPKIEKYISDLYENNNDVFAEMEAYADENQIPIIGPLAGKFLSQICLIKRPGNIFELGSGFGYSALWFAKSLGSDATITCSDYSLENSELAKSYFKKDNELEKLNFFVGNSLEILKNTDVKYDMIFNDIDKEYYPEVIEIVYEKLNSGGIFISDNVLWYGRVVEDDNLPSTKGIKKFNNLLFSHKGFNSTLIPLRDGISISVKV